MSLTTNQIISKLKTVSYKNGVDSVSLDDYLCMFESPDKDIEIFREHGLPELRRLLKEGLSCAKRTNIGNDLLYLMKILAMYELKIDANIIVKVANSGYMSGDYMWQTILDQFHSNHPYWPIVLDGLKSPLPTNFLKVAYLDFANIRFIENPTLSMVHPFDSQAGIRDLEKWLSSNNADAYSYAYSATSALPFVSEPARSKLLKLSQSHPDSGVKIKSAWALITIGNRSQGIEELKKWVLDPRYSKIAIDLFMELGLEDEIPDSVKNDDFLVLAEMASWLSHPQEYGRPPKKLEIFDKRELYWPPDDDRRPVWLIKYTYSESDWGDPVQIGMVGSVTFSFSLNESLSADEIYGLHCAWELCQYEDPRAPEDINPQEGLKILRTYNKDL